MATNYPTKCKNCGGDFVFDPKSGNFVCKNCGSIEGVIFNVVKERDFYQSEVNEKSWSSETKSIKCNACGAVDVMNKGDLADVCPFCGSSNIVDSSESFKLKPDGIVLFRISKEDAAASFRKRVKKSIWAPKDFKKSVRIDKIKPIYTPVFAFDCFSAATYEGRFGKDEEVTRRNYDGTRTTSTETRWFNASGRIRQNFDDVLVAAGQMISAATISALEPFETNGAIEFDKAFLSGCTANSYNKDLSTSFEQAKQIMEMELRERIMERNNADRVASLTLSIDYSQVKFKYILLPIYVSGYRYKDKNYTIYVNGTNGNVTGKLPVSRKKVWGTVFGVLLGIGAIVAAIMLL